MPRIATPTSFKKKLRKKPHDMQGAIARTVRRLGDDPWHPSLRTSRLRAAGNDVWYARIDGGNRLTFDWVGDLISLRVHCNHDILRTP